MKKPIYILSLMFLGSLLSICASCQPKASQEKGPIVIENPLDVKFGDPFILDGENGTYYMYGTGGGAKDGFSVYTSDDLLSWDNKGQVFYGNTDDSWSVANFWAPEVYRFDDQYYMFYSADWRENPTQEEENFRIGVAVADDPLGPFHDIQNQPIFDPGYPIIDANVYKEDGKYYLYYSRACYKHPVESEIADWAREEGIFEEIEESWVYGVELKPDFSGVIGEPVMLLRPPLTMDDEQSEWESRSVTSKEVNRRWTEGSFIFKHGEKYYIMYSANHFGGEHYAVGYATGDSPLGPFVKSSTNPIIEKNTASGGDVTGTGHNSILFLSGNDQMYAVYHGRTKNTGQERVVFIDAMFIDEKGKLEVQGPTTSKSDLRD